MEKIIQTTTTRKRCWLVVVVLMMLATKAQAQGNDIKWLRSLHHPGGSSTMNALSYSSYGVVFAVPATQLLYGYIADDSASKINGWKTFASLVATTGATYILKYAIDRPRPYETYKDIIPYRYESSHSMPSGHTSISFSTATSLSLQYKKWYVVAPAFAYAGFIGYTRMYAGDHYPSDVLVGALVGMGSAWLCHKGHQWLHKSKIKKK